MGMKNDQIALSREDISSVGEQYPVISRNMTSVEKRVIAASSMGTIFEMYDFFLAGALSTEIAKHFFSGVNPSAGFILALLGFAAGFVMRPFGGMIFGRFGDLIGRKRTFLATILIMGIATFTIGLLPGFRSIGLASPILFVIMRMLQGLAIGGEFGGAFIYVAEHGSKQDRGFRVSWVVSTGAGGLLLSLLVVLPLWSLLGDATFSDWGWRLPFLFSIVILLISLWIRLKSTNLLNSCGSKPKEACRRRQFQRRLSPLKPGVKVWPGRRTLMRMPSGLVSSSQPRMRLRTAAFVDE
jgi:MFS family permease